MPPKRRALEESDSEGDLVQSSPASKRPRTTQPDPTQAGNVDTHPDAEEEIKFEKDHEGAVMERILEKQNSTVAGGIAEMGIIESVDMIDFMCHKYLTFNFGPQVNFIIGHNGSGKSAVLSAITVALGGKATTTGRGSGLKSFVREGQQMSEVTISLKNQGEEAYKPKIYGKSIIITRRFTKDGSSSYKIKSKDGKVISTKREELSAICDHMNIQVDNPMNVLTQDSARQFLSASHATDKYRFFLKGTQLSQLSDEYETCMENIVQTDKILSRKREALPDLRDAYKQASRKFEEASKAIEQRHKIDELKKELAWTHVASKEQELKEKIQDVVKAEGRLPKLEAELTKAQAAFVECEETITQREAALESLGDVENLHDERKTIQAKISENRKSIQQCVADIKRISKDNTANNGNIEEIDKKIEEEARRMETHTRERRDEARQRLDQAKADMEANDAQLKLIENDIRAADAETTTFAEQSRRLDLELQEAETEIRTCKEQIKNCEASAQNKLLPYGNRISDVAAQVQRMKWHGQTPMGPLGVHVKLKDQQWADVMKVMLGPLMTAWAVTDARDRQQVKALLERTGNRNVSIIIAEVDLFDFSRGEPDSQYVTPLRVLDISDPYILRILVNQRHIESVLLARSRKDGDDLLLRIGGGGVAWCSDRYLVRRFPEGGGQSQPLGQVQRYQHQLFAGGDTESNKRNWMDKLAHAEAAHRGLVQQRTDLRSTSETAKATKARMTAKANQVHSYGLQLLATYQQLQAEANEELPAGIAGLQEMKDSYEAEKANLRDQLADIIRRKNELDALQQPLVAEVSRLKKQMDSFEENKQVIAGQIEELVASRMQARTDKDHYANSITKAQEKVKEVQQIADVTEQEFEEWTKTAEAICPRVPAHRSVEAVERNLHSLNKALKEREKKQGASVEEITKEVSRTKSAYDSAREDIKTMVALNKDLNQAVKIRLARWHDFRRHIALRCKVFFQYNLSNRGYFGKVLFDHTNQMLQLRVQTEDTGGAGPKEKDPKALSGGEKSFSTICLLLALWESIGCPIRCLDEFDVFMDAVNRRISMKMMTDTAKASDGKQYILITPQDMNNVKWEPHVKIHKMQDPIRNQGILAFS